MKYNQKNVERCLKEKKDCRLLGSRSGSKFWVSLIFNDSLETNLTTAYKNYFNVRYRKWDKDNFDYKTIDLYVDMAVVRTKQYRKESKKKLIDKIKACNTEKELLTYAKMVGKTLDKQIQKQFDIKMCKLKQNTTFSVSKPRISEHKRLRSETKGGVI